MGIFRQAYHRIKQLFVSRFVSGINEKKWIETGQWAVVKEGGSSWVQAIRYSLTDRTLFAKFNKGAVVRYKNIDPDEALNLFRAPRFGVYIRAHLYHRGELLTR